MADLAGLGAARAEVDRVLDRPRVRAGHHPGPVADLGAAGRDRRPGPATISCRIPACRPWSTTTRTRRRSLAVSVEEYLDRFGDVRAAASDLHIHPNTLRYRIRRAEQVLGMSLDDPEDRLLLQIQLLIWPSRSRPVGR